jgi:hypothetical protein
MLVFKWKLLISIENPRIIDENIGFLGKIVDFSGRIVDFRKK